MANRIKELRKRAGLTQEALGQRIGGVSKNNVSRWESGTRQPPITFIPKIAKVLGCGIEELFLAEEQKETAEKDQEGQQGNSTPPVSIHPLHEEVKPATGTEVREQGLLLIQRALDAGRTRQAALLAESLSHDLFSRVAREEAEREKG